MSDAAIYSIAFVVSTAAVGALIVLAAEWSHRKEQRRLNEMFKRKESK